MGKGQGETEEFRKLCGAATFYLVLALAGTGLFGLGIGKIVVGSTNLQKCSLERLIPIYLLVSGVVPIFFSGFASRDGRNSYAGIFCGVIGLLFTFAWLICGTVWVYPTYATVTSSTYTPCVGNMTSGCIQGTCSRSLLNFAFAMVTIDWVLMGLLVVVCFFYALKECK